MRQGVELRSQICRNQFKTLENKQWTENLQVYKINMEAIF